MSSEKNSLVESNKAFTKDVNAVTNLKFAESDEVNPFTEKLSHPILKANFKWSKHWMIIAINNATNV